MTSERCKNLTTVKASGYARGHHFCGKAANHTGVHRCVWCNYTWTNRQGTEGNMPPEPAAFQVSDEQIKTLANSILEGVDRVIESIALQELAERRKERAEQRAASVDAQAADAADHRARIERDDERHYDSIRLECLNIASRVYMHLSDGEKIKLGEIGPAIDKIARGLWPEANSTISATLFSVAPDGTATPLQDVTDQVGHLFAKTADKEPSMPPLIPEDHVARIERYVDDACEDKTPDGKACMMCSIQGALMVDAVRRGRLTMEEVERAQQRITDEKNARNTPDEMGG